MSIYNPGAGFSLRSQYGWRDIPRNGKLVHQFHPGIDYAANPGTPIPAAYDGTVIFSGLNGPLSGPNKSFGYTVIIASVAADGSTFYTLYGHMNGKPNTMAEVGQRVTAGLTIGQVGNTGAQSPNGFHISAGWPT